LIAMTRRRISGNTHLGSMLFVRAILAAVVLAMGYTAGTRAAERISEENAHAIGVQAYLYLYSLVTMDLTRKQLTNIERPEGIHAPMNAFANVAAYPTGADDHLGAQYRWPLLHAADARYVDRRVCFARLAHDWH